MPTYNKLVRDKIPQVIQSTGKSFRTKILDETQYLEELRIKLKEELQEYLAADTREASIEELADLAEVIHALAEAHGGSVEELEAVRRHKAEKRGGFKERVYLIDVDDEA